MDLVIAGCRLRQSYLHSNIDHKAMCSVKFHYYGILQCLDGRCCLVYLQILCLVVIFFVVVASSFYAWILLASCNGIRLNDNMNINIFKYVNEVSCCLCQLLEWQNCVCMCLCVCANINYVVNCCCFCNHFLLSVIVVNDNRLKIPFVPSCMLCSFSNQSHFLDTVCFIYTFYSLHS